MPNSSNVSTYAVPPETQLPHGGGAAYSDEAARAKRVQQQVAMRLAEKSTLPRRTTSTSASSSQYATISSSQYPTSEYSGSATMMKYQTYNPGFSSKSYMYATAARPVMANRASQHSSSGYSSRSAMDFGTRAQMSRGAAGGLMYSQDDMGGMAGMGTMRGGYQGRQSQQYQMSTTMRSMGRGDPDAEIASLHSLRLQPQAQQQVNNWMTRNGSEGSLGSDQDATYSRQEGGFNVSNGYAATFSHPYSSVTVNDFTSGARQTSATLPFIRRSLSGTLAGNGGPGMNLEEEAYVRQSYKGPSQRTINRITQNRQNRYAVSAGNMQTSSTSGGFVMGANGSQGNLTMKQGRISRAPSMRSMISVGKGKDVYDGVDITGSIGNLSGLGSLDMPTALSHLMSEDKELQTLGAAYIQHECYHNKDAKRLVNQMCGIPLLVQLFNSESQRVQQYATGAARNLIYENMENKVALIEAEGIPKLLEALKEPDDELQKNITGILWNLSSKDNLKEKLAKETLPKLTDEILIPLSGRGEREIIDHNDSEADIFCNTTGCLRNLSSINTVTRKQMRDTPGLIDALVGYIQKSVEDTRIEGKGVENSMCVLRNLSFQLYDEIPPSVAMRLEGGRNQVSARGEPIGCFTPQSRKAKDIQNQDLSTFAEVARVPKGSEWLWHPKIISLYNNVITRCETNTTTREAATGALQNITAGDKRWPALLSRVALEQERMLPTILDKLNSGNDIELRSLTGFLRNLSRHSKDKNALAPKVVSHLVALLPVDGMQKSPSPDVVINICGALNNLVSSSEVAARDISYFDGLPKLVGIKSSHDNSPNKQKQARGAATVLCNLYQYKKLHKEFKKKGFQKADFSDMVF